MPSSILVVDDEQLIRWSLRTHLEHSGYRVDVAETGSEALDHFGDDVGLVLLDLKLPDTNGLTLLKEMKRKHPGCQVILMTAYGTPEVASEALRCGAYQVFDKPFDLDEMARTVKEALAGRSSTSVREDKGKSPCD